MTTVEPSRIRLRWVPRTLAVLLVAGLVLAPSGCGLHSKEADKGKDDPSKTAKVETVENVRPEMRDMRLSVAQPGTIEPYEVTPLYSRLSGYVDHYKANIGDRVKKNDVLLEMWIPDLVETYAQKSATVKRADVQIQVTQSMLKADEARVAMTIAALSTAESGIKKAQANYDRWESESRRIKALAASKVIDEQVRDETYRQFEESVAAREQAYSMVSEAIATRDRAMADRDKAKVDIDAARARPDRRQGRGEPRQGLRRFRQDQGPV